MTTINKKVLTVSLYFIFLNCISFGQKPTENIPININELNIKLDSIFNPFNTKTSPGCAIIVLQNGKPISKKAYGMASIELQVPFSHQSVVLIGYSEAR